METLSTIYNQSITKLTLSTFMEKMRVFPAGQGTQLAQLSRRPRGDAFGVGLHGRRASTAQAPCAMACAGQPGPAQPPLLFVTNPEI